MCYKYKPILGVQKRTDGLTAPSESLNLLWSCVSDRHFQRCLRIGFSTPRQTDARHCKLPIAEVTWPTSSHIWRPLKTVECVSAESWPVLLAEDVSRWGTRVPWRRRRFVRSCRAHNTWKIAGPRKRRSGFADETELSRYAPRWATPAWVRKMDESYKNRRSPWVHCIGTTRSALKFAVRHNESRADLHLPRGCTGKQFLGEMG